MHTQSATFLEVRLTKSLYMPYYECFHGHRSSWMEGLRRDFQGLHFYTRSIHATSFPSWLIRRNPRLHPDMTIVGTSCAVTSLVVARTLLSLSKRKRFCRRWKKFMLSSKNFLTFWCQKKFLLSKKIVVFKKIFCRHKESFCQKKVAIKKIFVVKRNFWSQKFF